MLLTRSTSLLVALLACSAALAAQPRPGSSGREAFFRCTDANGQTHYGDRQPAACFGHDTQVLNERGTVLRVIEGDQSRAARIQREARESVQQRQREEQAQHDRMLIDTYLTVEDIERLRNQRLELLEAQLNVTKQNIVTLRDRESRLQQQVARFRPYSDLPNAPPLPDHLAEDMVNTVNSLQTYEEAVVRRQAEQEALRASFARDIARFKQLKGIR